LGGGSALDAVCATVVKLEDNPIFNAGTGAVLNFDGFCELDASVMESRESRVGAVAALQRVKNPILVARKVMEETDHVMLAGEGALRFARVMGFGDHDPVTPARKADWADKRKHIDEVLGKHGLKMRRFLMDHPEYAGGTVGCVAVDNDGILAAATSTGGVTMKLVGRVGDSPLAGAGNYASRYVAASATGTGEFVIRTLAARAISDAMERGASLDRAMGDVLDRLHREFSADIGLIAVDGAGTPLAKHLSRDMPHAGFSATGEVFSRMRVA
jgi:beta-aspartyl-peptidase (threonine type)